MTGASRARPGDRPCIPSNKTHTLTRVPGPPIGVTRLGSPASPRLVPVAAVACRAYRDPGGVNKATHTLCYTLCHECLDAKPLESFT